MKTNTNGMKFWVFLIITGVLTSCGESKKSNNLVSDPINTEKLPYSQWMADSEMKRNPEGWMIDFRSKPKWEYTHGLVCTSVEKVWEHTGEQKYFDYIKEFADTMVNDQGEILTYSKKIYNIDRVNPGKFLIELYKETNQENYKMAIDTLRQQMREHPRTSEGGFWHKKRYPSQMWLDGLYMGSPFLAQYAAEFNEPELFADVANQFYLINKYTWDEEKQAFYHGWDESREQRWSDPKTGLSKHFWGRAMGWLSMAAVDVLDFMPVDHPDRDKVLTVVNNLAVSIKKYQDPESGLWWQVIDQGGREGNYLESSASCMFVLFLTKAVKNGYLDESYLPIAKTGYQAILDRFIREEKDGTISLTDVCAVAGLGGDPYRDGTYEYYINEPKRDNDAKGIGPFIMASLELETLDSK